MDINVSTSTGCHVYLCDFHREQAWERWFVKKDHGVSTQKDLVLCLIRRVAHASTEAQFGLARASCKSSEVWKEDKKFRGWFENKWLKHHKVNIIIWKQSVITLM